MTYCINILYLGIFLILSPNLYAFSKSPSAGGEVGIKIINNTPCAYIKKEQLQGEYNIIITEVFDSNRQENSQPFFYSNSFEKHYPLENKCILLNSSNFQNLKFKENTPYSISLSATPYWVFDGFSSSICLKQNQEKQLIIQDYIYGKCMDKVSKIQKSPVIDSEDWFSRLLSWFKRFMAIQNN